MWMNPTLTIRRILSSWATFALAAAPLAPADERPVMDVRVTIQPADLPPQFSLYPAQLLDELRLAIEQRTRIYCGKRFPYLQWQRSEGASQPAATARVELTIEGGGQGLPSVRIRSQAACGKNVFSTLFFPQAYLYRPGEPVPDPANPPAEILSEFKRRAEEVVQSIFEANAHIWTEVASAIPLARRIIPQAERQRLVIPISASDLGASIDSTLRANFASQLPPASLSMGWIEARPVGRILSGELSGMQDCQVSRLFFPTMDVNAWHEKIPELLNPPNLDPESMLIFMSHFVPDQSAILRNLD